MPVEIGKIMGELNSKIRGDEEVERLTKKFAEEVKEYWKSIAPDAGNPKTPWASGVYKESIIRVPVQGHDPRGRFLYHHRVLTFDPVAHLLEYGTVADRAGPASWGNWIDLKGEHQWGWRTPTRAYRYAAQTAIRFNGTPD